MTQLFTICGSTAHAISRHTNGPLCYICAYYPRLWYIRSVSEPLNGLLHLTTTRKNLCHHLCPPRPDEMLVVIPDETPITGPTLDASYSAKLAADASANFDAPEHSRSKRDPHDLPDFSDSYPQTSPVLFLPPLLSSLPYGLSHTPAPSPDQPPLTTETHLPDIDPASLSLHRALHYFSPVGPHYATQPYAESFNWDSLRLPEDQEREWYVVAFRSKRKPGSDSGCESNSVLGRA